MDPYDFGAGLINAVSRGAGAYFDARERRDQRDLEAAAKGLIFDQQSGKYVDDPAFLARERRKRIAQSQENLLGKGYKMATEDAYDDLGFLKKEPEINEAYFKARSFDDPYGSKSLAAEMARTRLAEMQNQKAEKQIALETPFGQAMTPEDAKLVKEAASARAQYEDLIQKMIELRKEYGGEVLNQAAVARGKQLSDNALLALKKLEQLGVLSASDIQIARNVIPENPLGFSGTQILGGKDPILSTLESAKADAADKMQAQILGRLRPSGLVKTGILPKTDATPKLSAEDAQALEWANAHPDDPRSAAIKKALGGK